MLQINQSLFFTWSSICNFFEILRRYLTTVQIHSYCVVKDFLNPSSDVKLDICIVWNAHIFLYSIRLEALGYLCASYFLHSTRPSVTWLKSRWWLAACDWVMSALSAVLSTRVGRRRKFRVVSCTECTFRWNDFELIQTVEMKTRNPVEGFW